MHQAALWTHIVLGAASVALAPAAILAALRSTRPGPAERVFCWLVVGLCAAAAWLSLTDAGRLWPFLLVTALTAMFAARAWRGQHRQGTPARVDRLAGAGGATIALATAILVVSATFLGPLAWLAPAAVGVPLLHRAERRLAERVADAGARAPENDGRLRTAR